MPKYQISNELRRLIIAKYENGEKIIDIAKSLLINYNTVKSITRRYKNNGIVEIQQRSGRPKN